MDQISITYMTLFSCDATQLRKKQKSKAAQYSIRMCRVCIQLALSLEAR